MPPLPSAWAHKTGLSTEVGILEFWDIIILIIRGTCVDTVCSSLLQHGPREPIPVSWCCTSTYYFEDGPHGPGYGSGSRLRLPDWYFSNPGACLRCGTVD